MTKCNVASIDSIETMGMLDGPGIRTIVFFNGCNLRCKYCHNPEMQTMKSTNTTLEELYDEIMKNKEYFGDKGGVTFSGGEPLLQSDFLVELSKKLKEDNIHIALDTAGTVPSFNEKLLEYIDLVILDVKALEEETFKDLVNFDIKYYYYFLDKLKKYNNKLWIRQVIIPDVNDNYDYINKLHLFLKDIPNIEKIEFLPYHKYGDEKYIKLGINNPYKDKESMDINKCNELYEYFKKID